MPRFVRILLLILCCSGFCCLPGVARAQSVDLAGIAHAAFRVQDVARSRAFYEQLGFQQSFDFSQDGRVTVSYVKVNDRQFIELYQRLDDSQPIGFTHICFESNDIASLWKEYVRRGLDAGAPRKAKAGNLLNGIHDPEGRLIEFTQYMPGSLHFEDRGKHLGERRVSRHLWIVAMPAKDPKVERTFYLDKLGFAALASGRDGEKLRLPGESGEEVRFVSSGSVAAPQIIFEVGDLQRAAEELRARGLQVQEGKELISVVDPDGIIIGFAARQ
ncbi:MAG: VOC family protein [Candidatus Acidiferrales bacterium]